MNPSGHSLYMFKNDRNGKSTCSGNCAKFWPPLIAHGKPTAGPGAKNVLLGTTKRSDGRLQVTYRKHPLYTFAPDKQPGQVNGQGSGGVWYVMSTGGAPIVKALATTAPATTTTSGDGTTTPGATTTRDHHDARGHHDRAADDDHGHYDDHADHDHHSVRVLRLAASLGKGAGSERGSRDLPRGHVRRSADVFDPSKW